MANLSPADATDEDLPAEAVQQAAAEREEAVEGKNEEKTTPTAKVASKKPQRKGPPRGIFIDEGDKASGILDPTGKILLITHPHLLGEEFARRYANSPSSTPSSGFLELIEGSDAGDSQATGDAAAPADVDPLVTALAATDSAESVNIRVAMGLGEAPYPAPGFSAADYLFEGNFQDDNAGEDVMGIDDVIQFDDSDGSDEKTSPIYMPPKQDLLSSNGNKIPSFAHTNVTAFRNNADPSFTPFGTSHFAQQLAELTTPTRRTPSTRKRKRVVDSPYSSSHYAGVTPIQRIRDPNPPSAPATPDSTVRPKRRRLMTA